MAVDASNRAVLSHLRKVAKLEQLPEKIRRLIHGNASSSALSSCNHPSNACHTPDKSLEEHNVVYILLCRASVLQEESLKDMLQDPRLVGTSTAEQIIVKVRVPIVPPTTQEQASSWSQEYWPTIYKKHNPYGPQHNVITEATAEIAETAPIYMDLAHAVGKASCVDGRGRSAGAVVIDRGTSKEGQIIAVAGDARWHGNCDLKNDGRGNSMAHAAMRAIAIVARKRKAVEDGTKVYWENLHQSNSFLDHPITGAEWEGASKGEIDSGGYLCLNLEIYLTHEPCVMCSMALLHARFGKVIFGKRMPLTGGLVTEDGRSSGYGLFWLPSLNWKMLAWQWAVADIVDEATEDRVWHA